MVASALIVVNAGLSAGCAQILGIEPLLVDDPDAPPDNSNLPQFKLTTQTAVTRADTGGFDPVLLYTPISPPPAVQIGPVDGPLQPAVYKEDGTVEIPTEIFDLDQWRVVYTLDGAPDSAPREVHWHPPGTLQGHLVEPMFGRPERLPVPAGGGYSIVPPNLNVNFQHTNTRVFSTGIWTEGSFLAVPQGAALEYDFGGKALSMSGPLGAPERDKNDFGVLADYGFFGGAPNLCRVATGAAAFKVPSMMAGGRTPPDPQPTYGVANKQVSLEVPPTVYSRLDTILGARAAMPPLDTVRWRYGYAPSPVAFGFSRPPVDVAGVLSLPAPQMIALADCTFRQGDEILETPPYADLIELRDRFPRIVHAEVIDTRMVNGIQLRSGFSAVLTSNDGVFRGDFGAAGVTRIELYRGGTKIANLADDPDGAALPAGTGPLVLDIDLEGGADVAADYFEITLYSLTTQLVRQRIYTTAAKQLTIEPSFLLPETEYVFEIRSYRGRAGAASGDFRVNTYPQYATTVFSRTFKTP